MLHIDELAYMLEAGPVEDAVRLEGSQIQLTFKNHVVVVDVLSAVERD